MLVIFSLIRCPLKLQTNLPGLDRNSCDQVRNNYLVFWLLFYQVEQTETDTNLNTTGFQQN